MLVDKASKNVLKVIVYTHGTLIGGFLSTATNATWAPYDMCQRVMSRGDTHKNSNTHVNRSHRLNDAVFHFSRIIPEDDSSSGLADASEKKNCEGMDGLTGNWSIWWWDTEY